MGTDKQIILHTLELSREDHPSLGSFQLHFMLKVPRSHIAIDLKSGFPNLMEEERRFLERVVRRHFQDFLSRKSDQASSPLVLVDQFLRELADLLPVLEKFHPTLAFEGVDVSLFLDVRQAYPHPSSLHSSKDHC